MLPVRVAASASCASEHSSGLACARAFGFPGSWDLGTCCCHVTLKCSHAWRRAHHVTLMMLMMHKVILTAMVAAQPNRTGVREGWPQWMDGAPIRHPSFFAAPKGQGEKVCATWGLRCRTNSPICALQPTSM